MEPVCDPKSHREVWLDARRHSVGGSEIAALFNCQPAYALSHYALWMVKAGRVPEPEVTSERASWGLHLEDAIAAAAAERYGLVIERGGWTPHAEVEGMAATTDYLVADGAAFGWPDEPGVMEVKNADWLIHKRQWGDEPPLHVLLQLQHQLACTGRQWGVVVALIGGNRLAEPYAYAARPALIAEMERRVRDFWRSIRDGEPPEPDGSDSTLRALRELYPSDDRREQPLDLSGDNEAPGICAAYLEAAERRRAAERAEKAAKAQLLAKLGNARLGRCAGFLIEAPTVGGTPDRVAEAGEVIKGRAGHRRLSVKERNDG